MESAILTAAQGFNLRLTKTKIYRDKFGFICTTNPGPVRIQRWSQKAHVHADDGAGGSAIASIMFQHEIKECLHKRGLGVDRFVVSHFGTPYVKLGDDVYTACYALSHPTVDFTDTAAFLDVTAHVAKMHQCIAEANIHTAPLIRAKIGDDITKSLNHLTKLRKKLLKAGRFSDFDMLFLRGYEKFVPHIDAFCQICENTLTNKGHICHNLLKEENIYLQDGKIVVTNFVEAAPMHHFYDLAYITKRHIRAQMPLGDIAPFGRIFQTYVANNPGCTPDEELFRRILAYPDKFIKVTTDYYSKKRSFAPNTYLSRMGECLRMGDIINEAP